MRFGVDELCRQHRLHRRDRLEEWPDFFVEQCRYLITSRASYEAGLPHRRSSIAASRGMLMDRVTALRQANIYEPHRYRHLVGPTASSEVDGLVMRAIQLHCGADHARRRDEPALPPAAISTAST